MPALPVPRKTDKEYRLTPRSCQAGENTQLPTKAESGNSARKTRNSSRQSFSSQFLRPFQPIHETRSVSQPGSRPFDIEVAAMIHAHIRIQVSRLCRGHCGAGHPATIVSRLLLAAALVGIPSIASAEIIWHRDLPAARAASAASGKPVFALFVATWDEKPNPEVFANAEVDAVISACFEPVRVDVDARPDVVKALAIDRIPSVAVLDSHGRAISRFDCPTTPAEFVAAAARAAQVTASTAGPRNDTEQPSAAGVAAFGGGFEANPSPHVDDTSVADKVRQLSSFAEGKATPLRDSSRFPAVAATAAPALPAQPSPAAAPTATAYAAPSVAAYSPPVAVPTADPSLARTPPAWPAERPAGSAYSRFQPAPPPAAATAVIEPAPSVNSAPWIAAAPGTAAPAGQPADAEPEATATASDDGAAAKAKPNAFLAALQKPMSAFSNWTSKPTVEPPPKMPPARPQLPSALAAAPIAPSAAAPATAADPGPLPLGLEGYCPVTIAERGAWVEGRAQWGVRHRGRTYLFAGPEQQQSFLANPDQFAPALAGDDPVLAFESGRSEPGQRAFGVTFGSRMYLFSSPETRAAFTADPNRYTTRVQIAEGLAPSDAARRF